MGVETALFIVLWSVIIIAVFSLAYIFLIDTNSVEDSTKVEPNSGSPGASPGASGEVIPKTSPEPIPEEPKKRTKASEEKSTKTRTKTEPVASPAARPKARPKARSEASPGVAGYDGGDESARLSLRKKAAAAAGLTLTGGGTALSLRELYRNLYGQEFPSDGPEVPEGRTTPNAELLGGGLTTAGAALLGYYKLAHRL